MANDLRVFLALLWMSGIVNSSPTSFVVESSSVVKGSVLSQFSVDSMRECSMGCLSDHDCGGFNYLIRSDDKAYCLLIDVNKPEIEAELPLPEAVLYTAIKIHLKKECSPRTFAFERLAHLKAISKEIVLESGGVGSLEECLIKCQERSDCRAAQFNRHKSSCDLLQASPSTVYNVKSHFAYSDSRDIYENNCLEVPMSSSKCSFMRMNAAGLTDFYDEVISDVIDAEDCERKCIGREKAGDPCRSYTYDNLSKLCYISHQDSRSSGRSPLGNRNADLVHGTLDDCIDFALKCRNDALEIHGLSMRLFSGSMKTKRRKDVICEKKIPASYDFIVQMPYKECGIDKSDTPFRSHSGIVHVKEGSTNLITIRDKILQVNCHIHSQTDGSDQMLTTQMRVSEPNTTYRTLSNNIIHVPSQAPRPRYSLTVLNADGVETDVVRSAEHGWLSLKVNDDSENSIFVSNMVARDINSKKTVSLIGDDGCVTHRDHILGISRPSSREIRYKINFGGFDGEAQFVYQALVETCTFDCWPKCNKDLWLDDVEKKEPSENNVRVKRAIGPRQIELIQDIYKVHGGRITILTPLSSKRQSKALEVKNEYELLEKELSHEEGVQVEMMNNQPIMSALRHCFSDDVTCLFTVILASIQLFLLASCMCIVYCYIQQWRAYRSVSARAQVQYELNGEDNSSKIEDRQVQ